VKKLAKCPECGGKAKWESPFYVCTVCGLALRRREYERLRDKQKADLYEAQIDQSEEEHKKRRKNREYLDWYLGSKK
jgi:transcription elongation factor Elf1